MRTFSVLVLALLVSAAVASSFLFAQPRMDQALKDALASGAKKMPVMVYFDELNIQRYYAIESVDQRAEILVNDMRTHAELTQASIVQKLKQEKVAFNSLWISNSIAIRECPKSLINYLATHPLVVKVVADEERVFELETPTPVVPTEASHEWNVEWVQGKQVWDQLKVEGEGVTVGIVDTGAEYKHEAIKHAYRGLHEDGSYDHNYNWMQTIGGKPHNGSAPIDDHSHGSHCAGTILGRTSKGHSYGMAPKAKYISCKCFTAGGSGSRESILGCLQFMLAPTDLEGNNPDTSRRPDVLSNSYHCGGCNLKGPVDALVAAGIMFVAAAGNAGSRCSSVSEPASLTNVLAVGALEVKKDVVTSFSSRGPVISGSTKLVKPDITAPGRDIVSAMKGGGYGKMSGTSMACPHVAGGVALVWSAVKDLKHKPKETQELLEKFARHVDAPKDYCGMSGSTPNNMYGYGTMQVLDAIKGHNRF